MKRALITGITGQDGSYLAEYLLSLGYQVHGIIRRTSSFNTSRIDHLYQDPHTANRNLFLHFGDLADPLSLFRLIAEIRPHELYNLAAQSHVRVSFENPEYTTDITALGPLRLLEALKLADLLKTTRFYQASSSEMFGGVYKGALDENSAFNPRSPYACAKLYGHYITGYYRQAFNVHACSGILFNHESPRRGETFVTRKITRAAARIKLGLQDKLYLGNLDSRRDWGYAQDYVKAMHGMLQQETPEDFVIATGKDHSVREFCEAAFSYLDLDYREYIEIDEKYFRLCETDTLCGNAAKARKVLGWQPTVSFKELVKLMVEADLILAQREVQFASV